MKLHLGQKGKAWCNTCEVDIQVVSKLDLMKANLDGESVCSACLAKANEGHLVVFNADKDTFKRLAKQKNMSMKQYFRELVNSLSK